MSIPSGIHCSEFPISALLPYAAIASQPKTYIYSRCTYRQLHLFMYFMSASLVASPTADTHTLRIYLVKCSFIKFVHTRSNHYFVDVQCAFHISAMPRLRISLSHPHTYSMLECVALVSVGFVCIYPG